jgi:CTP:molybdopterin cytidylyltransferase MocA
MTGIILSGGGNTRMGQNKAFLRMGDERLIDRTVRLLRALFREVIIVVANPLDYLDQDAAIVTDLLPGRGALGGLYTGLFYSADEYAFVAACDIPLLNRSFIEYLALWRTVTTSSFSAPTASNPSMPSIPAAASGHPSLSTETTSRSRNSIRDARSSRLSPTSSVPSTRGGCSQRQYSGRSSQPAARLKRGDRAKPRITGKHRNPFDILPGK